MFDVITSIHSFRAILDWFELLQKYDDSYIMESIANFKTRTIQQKAITANKPKIPNNQQTSIFFKKNVPQKAPAKIIPEAKPKPVINPKANAVVPQKQANSAQYLVIEKNIFYDDIDPYFLAQTYAIQLQTPSLQLKTQKYDLYQSLENLSERLYDFFDDEFEEDSSIDFFA